MYGYVFREDVVSKEDFVGKANQMVIDLFLDVPTTSEYNNTEIRCGVLENISEPALLILRGKFVTRYI